MIRQLHHIGIVVADLDDVSRFMIEVLGLELETEFDVPELRRRVAFFKCGSARIELIDDLDPDTRERNLHGAPARLEHVALEVDDVEAEIARLATSGVSTSARGVVRAGGRLNVWTNPLTSRGVMFQLTAEDRLRR